jgi:hypothetical protein
MEEKAKGPLTGIFLGTVQSSKVVCAAEHTFAKRDTLLYDRAVGSSDFGIRCCFTNRVVK